MVDAGKVAKAQPDAGIIDINARQQRIAKQQEDNVAQLVELRNKQQIAVHGGPDTPTMGPKSIGGDDPTVGHFTPSKGSDTRGVRGKDEPAYGNKHTDAKAKATDDPATTMKSNTAVNDNARRVNTNIPRNKAELDPGYPAALKYREHLIQSYPNLKDTDLRPVYRNRGIPGQWEESMYTGGARLSWEADLRKPRRWVELKGDRLAVRSVRNRVQLDDIDTHGFVVDTKMRGLDQGVEFKGPATPDVVTSIGGKKRSWSHDPFPDTEREKLLAQLQFAKENNLTGVKWITNAPELASAVDVYVKKFMTDVERGMVKIDLVQR